MSRVPTSNLFTAAQTAAHRVDQIVSSPAIPRVLVVGAAGSGKSTVLRTLSEKLGEAGHAVHILNSHEEIEHIPAEDVLVVDDLHLLEPKRLKAVRARAKDPEAGLIAGCRPGLRSREQTSVERKLQRSAPPIILGQVSRTDVLAFLKSQKQEFQDSCIEDLLERSGGTPWIMTHVLSVPHGASCRNETHEALWRDVEEQVLHRLNTVDPSLRRMIERVSFGDFEGEDPTSDELIAHGFAEGLLLRNGSPIPIVRSAVRSAISVRWKASNGDVLAETIANAPELNNETYEHLVQGIRDSRVGNTVAEHADLLLETNPVRAATMYRAALDIGADSPAMPLRLIRGAWATGDLDEAARTLSTASPAEVAGAGDELTDTAAAIWAARGMMATAADVYGDQVPADPIRAAKAAIARVGAGIPDALEQDLAPATGLEGTSTLGVAMRLLHRGLRSSMAARPDGSFLRDLVRASELYTAAGATGPIPELPAVIAASAAIGHGDLPRAASVLDAAVAGGQGGLWAQRRLLLWQALIAIQSERPAEARRAFATAEKLTLPASPRDALLAHIIRITLVRRYEDLAPLQNAWAGMRDEFSHSDVDLFVLYPLGSLVRAVARTGDSTSLAPALDTGIEIVERLGSPPIWSVHLWWSRIQEGILLNRPGTLAPYATRLVAIREDSPLASSMAAAGGVWAAVLSGKVDPDAVEGAARSLAAAGLAWDGARLAGNGASNAEDRKVVTRLLSCARDLHPKESSRTPVAAETSTPTGSGVNPETQLSEREYEVARLILRGKTYVEIGESLFISPRTVEHHVAHMRRRLSATTRSDLLSKLRMTIHPSQESEYPETGDDGGESLRSRTHI